MLLVGLTLWKSRGFSRILNPTHYNFEAFEDRPLPQKSTWECDLGKTVLIDRPLKTWL